MLFKFLYTLCTIVGVNSHIATPTMMNQTIATIATASDPMENIIQINIKEDETIIHNLCNDFTPYIRDNACSNMLFKPSQVVRFVAINKTKMILKPKSYDMECDNEDSQSIHGQGIYNCYPKTYQFTINASDVNSGELIKAKAYSITIKNTSVSLTEIFILSSLVLSTSCSCFITYCVVAKCLPERPQVGEAPLSKDKENQSAKDITPYRSLDHEGVCTSGEAIQPSPAVCRDIV